jgi:hypothetical protein
MTILVAVLCPLAQADEDGNASKLEYHPVPSLVISYPLGISIGAGVLLPLGDNKARSEFPSVSSLRSDIEIGLGGSTASVGMFIPIDSESAVSIKGAILRTWLLTSTKTYNGLVMELADYTHPPLKAGLGYFRERDGEHTHLVSLFGGIGW